MKLKNVKVGQTVKVKETNKHMFHHNVGKLGVVSCVEDASYMGYSTVCVHFHDGEADWGNHKDIKLIEDVD